MGNLEEDCLGYRAKIGESREMSACLFVRELSLINLGRPSCALSAHGKYVFFPLFYIEIQLIKIL